MSEKQVSANVQVIGSPRLPVVLAPGDAYDIGSFGVLVWLEDEDANAFRLQLTKRQRELREALRRKL